MRRGLTVYGSVLLAVSLVGCGAPPTFLSDGGVDAPTTRAALAEFAVSDAYLTWPAEADVHPSAGPHGGNVRTWVNPALRDSLKAGNAVHPIGSIAVKRLYGSSTDRITGYAIDVKRDDGAWVFFEGFVPSLDQYYFVGSSNLCSGCHQAGVDQVLVPAAAFP